MNYYYIRFLSLYYWVKPWHRAVGILDGRDDFVPLFHRACSEMFFFGGFPMFVGEKQPCVITHLSQR